MNEFSYEEENLEIFKTLFDVFFSSRRPKEFVDFFVENEKFYAVFKYVEFQGIKEKYAKEFNLSSFEDRCVILESILIYIDKIYRFPHTILGCMTEPANIKVDSENNVHFFYDLHNIDSLHYL